MTLDTPNIPGQQGSDSFTGMWKAVQQPQLARDLMTPGELEESLMRGDFLDREQSALFSYGISRLIEEGLEDEIPTLKYRILADTAVSGKRAGMFLQGITGVLMPRFFGAGERTTAKRGFGLRTEEDSRDGNRRE